MFTPPAATIFEHEAGHFWGIHETRPYMRARYGLIESLLKIKTVKAASDHIMDMLHLCWSDNMGVRGLAPALFLRLGKDQECYDFLKWYHTTGKSPTHDWGDTDLGFLDIKDADIFKPVDLYTGEYSDTSHAAAVTLIKIRQLLDAKALDNATILGEKIPMEIINNIRGNLVSSIIAKNKDIMLSTDRGPFMKKLEDQIKRLYEAVNVTNKFFWPALINPGSDLGAPPETYSHGSQQHMRLIPNYNYASWDETPGAIDLIKEMVAKNYAQVH